MERREQLHQPSILSAKLSGKQNYSRGGNSNNNCTIMAQSSVVPEVTENINRGAFSNSEFRSSCDSLCVKTRAKEKLVVEDIRLESLWKGKLRGKGWSEVGIQFAILKWSPSTLLTYNGQLQKYLKFMLDRGIDPQFPSKKLLIDYMVQVSKNSDRPRSIMATNSVALSCYFDALDQLSPINADVRKCMEGIVKGGTTKPMKKSSVMPREPFMRMFKCWDENVFLTTECLRLKAVTLLSLSAMLRPSDIAPQVVTVSKSGIKNSQFTVDKVKFLESGDMKLSLHGIKNDYDRDGFEITIVKSSVEKVCPVKALHCYIDRIGFANPDPCRPVFTPLNYPYSALSASLIAKILVKSIDMAGLGNQGFSAKSFRPTGATAVVQNGVHPDRVPNIGRWKNAECFEKHYVHVQPKEGTSDCILLS